MKKCAFDGTVDGDAIKGLIIADGYHADPANWLAESANVIEIKPNLADIIFLNHDGSELYRETVPIKQKVANWPADPEKPAEYGDDYLWWGWVDADGNRLGKADPVTEEKTLSPKWVNKQQTSRFANSMQAGHFARSFCRGKIQVEIF